MLREETMPCSGLREEFLPIPPASKALTFLYETKAGRLLLRPFLTKGVSNLAGRFLDTPLSGCLIPVFLKKGGIDLRDYVPCRYRTFNDCFSRHIRPEKRPVDPDPTHLISPCDGLMRVYPITEGLVIPVKQSRYAISDLLRDEKLAREFAGGTCVVLRLCVNHYHRYSYPADGIKSPDYVIPGLYHTVQPIALRNRPVFVENAREYTVLDTEQFGRMVQMEVGALLVGRIANHDAGSGRVVKGAEKGTFLYGGSTIILLMKRERVAFPQWYYESAEKDVEIPVQCGQWLGSAMDPCCNE